MNISKIPITELKTRMERFVSLMDRSYPEWELCAIVGGVNMYWLSGTICDGMLIIRRGEAPVLWARRSYERAVMESAFEDVRPMRSFRDAAASLGKLPETLYLDTAEATLEWYGLLSKHMSFNNTLSVDRVMLNARAVKTPYEIDILTRAGGIVNRLLTEDLPKLLREGMTEAELGAEMFSLFIENGYHGLSRFSMRNTDVIMGHIGFGESPLCPSVFNGASGTVGLCPAAPLLGSRDIRLREGDLVYIDVCFGLEGYNTDKTLIYSYKKRQSPEIEDAHNHCLELQKYAASMLCAGTRPSDIYKAVCGAVRQELRERFMGLPGDTVPFIGHGTGLYVDEYPVIAGSFNEPLEAGMVIAVEPKMGIKGVGMVGGENTYLVTENGAVSLTGEIRELILVQ